MAVWQRCNAVLPVLRLAKYYFCSHDINTILAAGVVLCAGKARDGQPRPARGAMEPGLWGVRGGTVPELRRNLFCITTVIEAIALNLLHLPCTAKLRERHRVCHTPRGEPPV